MADVLNLAAMARNLVDPGVGMTPASNTLRSLQLQAQPITYSAFDNVKMLRPNLGFALDGHALVFSDLIESGINLTPAWETTVALPLVRSNEISAVGSAWHFDTFAPTRVPAEGVGRMLRSRTETVHRKLVRRGIQMSIENDFMRTPKGRLAYARNVESIVYSVNYGQRLETRAEMRRAAADTVSRWAARGLSPVSQGTLHDSLVAWFAVLNKDPRNLKTVMNRVLESFQSAGVVPRYIAAPPSILSALSDAKTRRQLTYLNYATNGRLAELVGPESVGEYAGMALLPAYALNNAAISAGGGDDSLGRTMTDAVQFGEYWELRPPMRAFKTPGYYAKYSTSHMDARVYNEELDRMGFLSMIDAVRYSRIFSGSDGNLSGIFEQIRAAGDANTQVGELYGTASGLGIDIGVRKRLEQRTRDRPFVLAHDTDSNEFVAQVFGQLDPHCYNESFLRAQAKVVAAKVSAGTLEAFSEWVAAVKAADVAIAADQANLGAAFESFSGLLGAELGAVPVPRTEDEAKLSFPGRLNTASGWELLAEASDGSRAFDEWHQVAKRGVPAANAVGDLLRDLLPASKALAGAGDRTGIHIVWPLTQANNMTVAMPLSAGASSSGTTQSPFAGAEDSKPSSLRVEGAGASLAYTSFLGSRVSVPVSVGGSTTLPVEVVMRRVLGPQTNAMLDRLAEGCAAADTASRRAKLAAGLGQLSAHLAQHVNTDREFGNLVRSAVATLYFACDGATPDGAARVAISKPVREILEGLCAGNNAALEERLTALRTTHAEAVVAATEAAARVDDYQDSLVAALGDEYANLGLEYYGDDQATTWAAHLATVTAQLGSGAGHDVTVSTGGVRGGTRPMQRTLGDLQARLGELAAASVAAAPAVKLVATPMAPTLADARAVLAGTAGGMRIVSAQGRLMGRAELENAVSQGLFGGMHKRAAPVPLQSISGMSFGAPQGMQRVAVDRGMVNGRPRRAIDVGRINVSDDFEGGPSAATLDLPPEFSMEVDDATRDAIVEADGGVIVNAALASRWRYASGMKNAVEKAAALALLLLPIKYKPVMRALENDVLLPLMAIVFSPFQEHWMSSLLVFRGGLRTGMNMFGNADAQAWNNGTHKVMHLNLTYYTRSIVINPHHIQMVPFVKAEGIIGGVNLNYIVNRREIKRMARDRGSLLAVVSCVGEPELPVEVNLLGDYSGEPSANAALDAGSGVYPNSEFLNVVWEFDALQTQFGKLNRMDLGRLYGERTTLTLNCRRGGGFYYKPSDNDWTDEQYPESVRGRAGAQLGARAAWMGTEPTFGRPADIYTHAVPV